MFTVRLAYPTPRPPRHTDNSRSAVQYAAGLRPSGQSDTITSPRRARQPEPEADRAGRPEDNGVRRERREAVDGELTAGPPAREVRSAGCGAARRRLEPVSRRKPLPLPPSWANQSYWRFFSSPTNGSILKYPPLPVHTGDGDCRCFEKRLFRMFYTQLFMCKRGPLAKIWLAAHWEKKITKAHVYECNLEDTVKDILSPKVKIALRTSGHLLLGVVRIYSKKAKYLLADCNEAVVKIRVAFRPDLTDLPIENAEATYKAITLAENFHDFESQLPAVNTIEVTEHFTLNQCRNEDITLREDYGNNFLLDDNFGVEIHSRQHDLFDNGVQINTDDSILPSFESLADRLTADGFGDEESGFDIFNLVLNDEDTMQKQLFNENEEKTMSSSDINNNDIQIQEHVEETSAVKETVLLEDEDQGFALEPIAESASSDSKKRKRKRKLVVDQDKELSNGVIREQIAGYSDIVTTFSSAPPLKKLMSWKENGGVDKLFRRSCFTFINSQLFELFPKDLIRGGLKRNTNFEEHEKEELRNLQMDGTGDCETLMHMIEDPSILQTSVAQDSTRRSIDHTPLLSTNNESSLVWNRENEEGVGETFAGMPSEDSLFVHPSAEIQAEISQTQTQSVQEETLQDCEDSEDRRINKRVQYLLQTLRKQSYAGNTSFSLQSLFKNENRKRVATMFFCFLVLKKHNAVELYQSKPYDEIIVKPGIMFNKL
ncbi:double-strand-break repair protein rad21-like protein 1 isoform X2 [Lepisosteus oculatus]|uniref:double-strand-break repair protein rad21-like protein 1 isoform X2 n=1 Tax=Lepisosteus oculatus TaxID=7918 RepID=UPI0035F52542